VRIGGTGSDVHENDAALIIDLGGKPLMAWSIEAALNSAYITKTVVSSDSNEILTVAKQFGAEALKRPDDLASDTAPSEPLIAHVIDLLNGKGEFYDFIRCGTYRTLRGNNVEDRCNTQLAKASGAGRLSSHFILSHRDYQIIEAPEKS